MKLTKRHVVSPILAAGTAVALAACGSNSPSSGDGGMPGMPGMTSTPSATSTPAVTGSHNQADITFATGMIPHHGQAITMAEMALTKATNASVKELATAIKAAQDPEIKTMSGWLQSWGQPVPSATGGMDMSHMGSATTGSSGMDGMAGMEGMMTAEEMTQLSNTTGAAFDRLWLQMMVKHHQGAVAMAEKELGAGQYPEAKTLAQKIITDQKKEIATMNGLLPTV